MRAKLDVAVMFGGRSCEHEVSMMSAKGIMGAIDRERFNVLPVGVTKGGQWCLLTGVDLARCDALDQTQGQPVTLDVNPSTDGTARFLCAASGRCLAAANVILPIIHGPLGEDGTLQGLLELTGVAYVGPGVLGSAVSMDKRVMKILLQAADLPVASCQAVIRTEWEEDPAAVRARCEASLPFPWYVKPANMGSSVGVSRVGNTNEFAAAMDIAARYDRLMLVEQGIEPAREIEVAVLGSDEPQASLPGEILPSNEFYDYQAKYIDGKSGLIIPAQLPEEISFQIRAMAVRAFQALNCHGLARVDFLYREKTQEIFILEANTLPGFTPISMYPKLWEATGLNYTDLISRLVELGIERRDDKAKNLTGVEIASL